MPTELLIAFIAFGVIPIGLMAVAAIIAWFTPIASDPYTEPQNWGSQDIDRGNS